MARNRMIKAEFWADEKVAKCNFITRLLFIGSWNFADDSGVCRANSTYLRNNILPYDSVNIKQIDEALEQLKNEKLIALGEFKGEKYLYILNFLKHQTINRPSSFRYIDTNYSEVFNLNSLQPHDILSEHSLPKEKEKEKENVNVNAHEDFSKTPKHDERTNASSLSLSDEEKKKRLRQFRADLEKERQEKNAKQRIINPEDTG